MAQNTLTFFDDHSAYPGQYLASHSNQEELMDELEQPHEGEAKPLVNIVEMSDAFIIEMATPGLKNSEFFVGINGNILTISLLHKDVEHSKKLYRQHEFNYCSFKRDIVIPENIDPDFISTVYAEGLLSVKLPKSIRPFIHRVDRILVY